MEECMAEDRTRRRHDTDEREARWADAMRRARRGDGAAYRAFLTEIATVLRGMARHGLDRYGFSPDEAEDVVQEVLLALHTRRDSWDETRPIAPWVFAIARYKLVDGARRLGRARRLTAAVTVDEVADLIPAPKPERDMTGVDAIALIGSLPPRERGVVVALVFEGISVAEIARRLGIGESAVRVAFHRALSRLDGAAA
jgi:RNA polymerase sigma-70 factor (ECF subfamily)